MNLNQYGWENAASIMPGEAITLPAGGYICEIKNAFFVKSKKGSPMINLCLDVTEGDFAGYFTKSTKRAKTYNPDKPWDNSGIYRQNICNNDGKISPYFKGLINALIADNAAVKNDFTPANFQPEQLFGARLGFVFGEEEYDFNGYSGVKCVPKFPKSIADINNGNFKIPDRKTLPADNVPKNTLEGTPISDDDTPF